MLPPSKLKTDTIKQLLGIKKSVPLTLAEMGAALRVCFYPKTIYTPRLQLFEKRLRSLLAGCGAQILDYGNALRVDKSERVQESVVIFAMGEATDDDLPINHVSSLSGNMVVSVFDRTCPAHEHVQLQAKLNAIVADLAWHCVHALIYLAPDGEPTVCNMNGAIVSCRDDAALAAALIPKLAAPVVPPRVADFVLNERGFDPLHVESRVAVHDLTTSGGLWKDTGLMVSQTPIAGLQFRNKYYRRIVTSFLDHRTGMSYGFLARQLPMPALEPAMTLAEARAQQVQDVNAGELFDHDGVRHLCVGVSGERYVLPLPEVWIVSTRSGCEKTCLDPRCDIVRYGLKDGCIAFETPCGAAVGTDCKPSYDTLVIVAHALANSITASVLARREPQSPLLPRLKTCGMALAHWHGFLPEACTPPGCFVHGSENPAVSCSTPQSAIYALQGRLGALNERSDDASPHKGDVHVEPHHGTNWTNGTLTEMAQWLLQQRGSARPPQ